MKTVRREILSWDDVNKLIDHLIPQIEVEIECMLLITRGGIIPGGLLAHAMDIYQIFTAAVDFPDIGESKVKRRGSKEEIDVGLCALPAFIQFPEEALLSGKRVLIVDDVWGSGRTMNAVRSRVLSSNGDPYTCVLHFNPHRNRFKQRPDFYAAITDAYIVYPWEIDRGWHQVLRLPTPPAP